MVFETTVRTHQETTRCYDRDDHNKNSLILCGLCLVALCTFVSYLVAL
jgi:hypothetical protein